MEITTEHLGDYATSADLERFADILDELTDVTRSYDHAGELVKVACDDADLGAEVFDGKHGNWIVKASSKEVEPCDLCRRVVCGCDALYEAARDMDRL